MKTDLSEEEYVVAAEEFIAEIDRLTALAEERAGESSAVKQKPEDAEVEAYMSMYPDKSREEIIKAMKRRK